MPELQFEIQINAPREKVWQVLWDDETYRLWTAVFMEGSYAESDWREGSRILFLTPSGNGMYSIIERKIPDTLMAFRHIGEIKDDIEIPKEWSGAKEAYHLSDAEGATRLKVVMDATGEMESYLQSTFPEALKRVKQLSEI